MIRWSARLLAALCLLLALILTTAFLLVRFGEPHYWQSVSLTFGDYEHGEWQFSVLLVPYRLHLSTYYQRLTTDPGPISRIDWTLISLHYTQTGFWEGVNAGPPTPDHIPSGNYHRESTLELRWFHLFPPLLLFPILWTFFDVHRRLHHRLTHHLCPTCAYDLRAHKTGDKCPECGTPIPPSPVSSPPSRTNSSSRP